MHTGLNIARQYDDSIREFEIESHKLLTNQAENIKMLF